MQVTTTRVGRMMDECAELQKRKSKTDELLKVMGHRIGILSIHLPPSSLDPQAAAAMQELSALKTTLYETVYICYTSKYFYIFDIVSMNIFSIAMKRANSGARCATGRTTSAARKSTTASCFRPPIDWISRLVFDPSFYSSLLLYVLSSGSLTFPFPLFIIHFTIISVFKVCSTTGRSNN